MVTILIVDDCRNLRLLYEHELEEEGYRVLLAEDSCQAVAQLHAHAPDVAVVEIEGRGAGLDLIRALRKFREDLPIVVNTGRSDVLNRGLKLVDACILKSSDLQCLKTAVRALPRGPAACSVSQNRLYGISQSIFTSNMTPSQEDSYAQDS